MRLCATLSRLWWRMRWRDFSREEHLMALNYGGRSGRGRHAYRVAAADAGSCCVKRRCGR